MTEEIPAHKILRFFDSHPLRRRSTHRQSAPTEKVFLGHQFFGNYNLHDISLSPVFSLPFGLRLVLALFLVNSAFGAKLFYARAAARERVALISNQGFNTALVLGACTTDSGTDTYTATGKLKIVQPI